MGLTLCYKTMVFTLLILIPSLFSVLHCYLKTFDFTLFSGQQHAQWQITRWHIVLSQWNKLKFDPQPSENAWGDGYRNWQGWLCPRYLPLCIFDLRSNSGILPPHIRNCLSNIHSAGYYFLGAFPTRYLLGRCTDFDDQYIKRRSFRQGCAFWGSQKLNLAFWPHFCQKMQICHYDYVDFWWDLENFGSKWAFTCVSTDFRALFRSV